MELKNQKGITLAMLVITIIVLLIITSITIYTGSNIIQKANLQNLNTNMLLIQAKVKTIGEDYRFNKDTQKLKGQKVSEITGNAQIAKLIDNKVIDSPESYYLLSQGDLDTLGLEGIKIEDGYLVNYETEEVIYVKGFEANNTIVYKLSQTKGLTIK